MNFVKFCEICLFLFSSSIEPNAVVARYSSIVAWKNDSWDIQNMPLSAGWLNGVRPTDSQTVSGISLCSTSEYTKPKGARASLDVCPVCYSSMSHHFSLCCAPPANSLCPSSLALSRTYLLFTMLTFDLYVLFKY